MSTCLHAINFRDLFTANLVASPLKFDMNETLSIHRVEVGRTTRITLRSLLNQRRRDVCRCTLPLWVSWALGDFIDYKPAWPRAKKSFFFVRLASAFFIHTTWWNGNGTGPSRLSVDLASQHSTTLISSTPRCVWRPCWYRGYSSVRTHTALRMVLCP